jgi:hypothetical protein
MEGCRIPKLKDKRDTPWRVDETGRTIICELKEEKYIHKLILWNPPVFLVFPSSCIPRNCKKTLFGSMHKKLY